MDTYKLVRSRRKTLGLEITPAGLTVRAPMRASRAEIERFVASHRGWIEAHMAKVQLQKQIATENALTGAEIKALTERAKKVIPERVAHYAPLVGVTYGRITVRCQKTRWGSCSSKGNLNFNCLLMLTPPEVLDSVVVHELCHRLEMNHSKRFYSQVYRVFPDYDRCHLWLKQNGAVLMQRAAFAED